MSFELNLVAAGSETIRPFVFAAYGQEIATSTRGVYHSGDNMEIRVPTVLTDLEIIKRCSTGELLENFDTFDTNSTEPSSLLNRCVALHNSSNINLLELTKTPQFEALSGPTFFTRQRFFCDAIPLLQTPVEPLIQAVQALVTKGGTDGAASVPNDAFRLWCCTDLARARNIIAAAQADEVIPPDFVASALIALGDSKLAQIFVRNYTDERQAAAVFAIGRIKGADVIDGEDSVLALLPLVAANNTDLVRGNAFTSLMEIFKQFPSLSIRYLNNAIAAASEAPTVNLHLRLSQALWFYRGLFDRVSIQSALNALKQVDASLNGAVHAIDVALKFLLEAANSDLVLDFLTDVLSIDGGFELNQFKTVKHDLIRNDHDRLFKLLVRWLISGNSNLGAAGQDLLVTGERLVPFDTTTGGLGLSGPDQEFLAVKALGWLFAHQVVAASILVACLRGCDSKAADNISELLFDPLLINYGGDAYDYLRTIAKGDKAYASVNAALKKRRKFVNGLKTNSPIKELRPSEYQYGIQRRRAYDRNREIQKGAEEHSIFSGLFQRSVLLYGRRSITFVREKGNKRRPITLDMRSFSHSFELPRTDITDPVGLNMMLLMFRSAKRR